MKYGLRYLFIIVAMTLFSLHSAADESMPNDTVYFYNSWQQMLDLEPMAYFVNPSLYAVMPHEIYFDTGDQGLDRMIEEEHLAISVGDSIWLASTTFLKQHFKGDTKNLSGFVPVFFNDKVAYLVAQGPISVKDVLFGSSDEVEQYSVDYYYIDFQNRKIKRITSEYLSELLEDYHDLQMRYEGMKDYKKRYIIEDYFFKYIDRATNDFMHPNILDVAD